MNKKSYMMFAAVMLIACCLRAPITGMGPLTTTIAGSLNLSATAAGLLTTLPLLTFAVVSFITGPLTNRMGAGRVMLLSLIVLIAGLLCRSWLGMPGLFIGSVVVGLGIGVNNVLLPPVIKNSYPEKMGAMTGAYTTIMAGFASLSMGISVPIALAIGGDKGWKIAICMWVVIAVLALIFWLPYRNLKFSDAPEGTGVAEGAAGGAGGAASGVGGAGSASAAPVKRKSVTRSSITWYITMFMGFQSILFYSFVAWFSTILQSKGYTPTTSGILNMVMMLCGLPGSFIMPIIASKTKHQSFWGAFIGLCYAISMVSTMFAEHVAPLVITIISYGFGSGAAIAFVMVMFNLHTKDAQDASSLSGFAQGIGYIMAAIGPVLIGKIVDATQSIVTGNWIVPLIVLTVMGLICTVFGWLSGLNKMVET